MMADTDWVYVERVGGRVRRITVLDDELRVISTHTREGAPDEDAGGQIDGQLMRTVELEKRVGLIA
jgi:hypothetical protein